MINWWDGEGARRTLNELKDLGLKTFWLPLKPGKDDDGKPIDYNEPAMYPVWEAIEESGLPVAHHIGENPAGVAVRVTTASLIGMVHNVAPFREMFGRYIFGGILDRHPGLRVGWFEGGINWVPVGAAGRRAPRTPRSSTWPTTRSSTSRRTTGSNHMYASFMVDPLGLELIDRIGVDRVMWSSDYPHNESTFGYCNQSLACVVDAVGAEATAVIVSGNVKRFLGIDD